MKTALIIGLTGQDGIHLTKLLLSKNYTIFGLIPKLSGDKFLRFTSMFPDVQIIQGSLASPNSLLDAISNSQPSEIYNLGAISYVQKSFDSPELVSNVNGLGPIRLLDAIRILKAENETRFYQASTSEMFGNVTTSLQNENTEFHPRSPYGASKVFAHTVCGLFRKNYGMHVSCGIAYNHEGEYRGEEYVTRKITKSLAQIVKGEKTKFSLGSLEDRRDWGYAGDYVEAMWLMLQQDKPDDYIIATGISHSIRDFLNCALEFTGLEGEIDKYVVLDRKFTRPVELFNLVGDASKAKNMLGWHPKLSFRALVEKMMINDLEH